MKMMYNGIPIKSLNIKHYEIDTNSCDVIASDMQAGKTAVARGKKITGTGKSFEFAFYGNAESNQIIPIPNQINVIEIASLTYPIITNIAFSNMTQLDFSNTQTIASVVIDSTNYPVSVQVSDGFITIFCDKTVDFQVFYGKDNYV